jgi:hypothetical protein
MPQTKAISMPFLPGISPVHISCIGKELTMALAHVLHLEPRAVTFYAGKTRRQHPILSPKPLNGKRSEDVARQKKAGGVFPRPFRHLSLIL